MRRFDHSTIVAADNNGVASFGTLDCLCPGTHHQFHATTHELLLKHGSDFGILAGQHLLPADDEGDLGPERREHVDELHAGDTGADNGNAVGKYLGRITVACREDAVTVRVAPLGDTRLRAG